MPELLELEPRVASDDEVDLAIEFEDVQDKAHDQDDNCLLSAPRTTVHC